MPEDPLSNELLIPFLNAQFEEFLRDDAFREILAQLDTDRGSLAALYNGRVRPDGSVSETQVLKPKEELLALRTELYPLFDALGAFRINKPMHKTFEHLLVLGGSLNACHVRTVAAKKFLSPETKELSGLACFRPIHPTERKNTSFHTAADTEFGALADSFARGFALEENGYADDFRSDRNLNRISCIRTFRSDVNGLSFRVFAAPSSEPETRRADTADTIRFFLSQTALQPSDTLLFLTHNRYCNRQFLQIIHTMLKTQQVIPFDVTGCLDDSRIVTEETFDPFQYLQDLISTLDWIERFRRDFLKEGM